MMLKGIMLRGTMLTGTMSERDHVENPAHSKLQRMPTKSKSRFASVLNANNEDLQRNSMSMTGHPQMPSMPMQSEIPYQMPVPALPQMPPHETYPQYQMPVPALPQMQPNMQMSSIGHMPAQNIPGQLFAQQLQQMLQAQQLQQMPMQNMQNMQNMQMQMPMQMQMQNMQMQPTVGYQSARASLGVDSGMPMMYGGSKKKDDLVDLSAVDTETFFFHQRKNKSAGQ